MSNPEQKTFSKVHLWRYLPILIITGAAVYVLIPQIATLQNSWSVVQGMIWWAVALAGISQVLSYLGSGFMLRAILNINQQKLPLTKGTLISMASVSIGLVAGGWVGAAAATYGWIRRESRDGNTAVLAGTLPALLNNGVLIGASLIGTIYLLLVHDLSRAQLIEFSAILLVLGLMTALLITAMRFPETAIHYIVWLAGRWSSFRHKPFVPENIISTVRQFVAAWASLRNGRWLYPMLGAIANVGFDMLTLKFMFIAAGHNVNPGVLFAGYSLPLILGKMAFLFPGGVGVIEGSMVALCESLNVPDAVCVVVILGYRLFSFWLPTLLGFAAAAYLSGRSSDVEVVPI